MMLWTVNRRGNYSRAKKSKNDDLPEGRYEEGTPRLEEQRQQLSTETDKRLPVFYFVSLFIN
jgi:hypothetical protein